MRAVVTERTGPPDVLRVADVAAREPGPREIRIAVAACGVCFHDVVVRNGTFRRGVGMPVILGHEVAGTVERLGSEVRDFKLGDLVATTIHSHVCGHCRHCRGGHETSCPERIFLGDAGLNGGYAELVCVDADAALKCRRASRRKRPRSWPARSARSLTRCAMSAACQDWASACW